MREGLVKLVDLGHRWIELGLFLVVCQATVTGSSEPHVPPWNLVVSPPSNSVKGARGARGSPKGFALSTG